MLGVSINLEVTTRSGRVIFIRRARCDTVPTSGASAGSHSRRSLATYWQLQSKRIAKIMTPANQTGTAQASKTAIHLNNEGKLENVAGPPPSGIATIGEEIVAAASGARYTIHAVINGNEIMSTIAAQLNRYRSLAELLPSVERASHSMSATTSPSHTKWSNAALIA